MVTTTGYYYVSIVSYNHSSWKHESFPALVGTFDNRYVSAVFFEHINTMCAIGADQHVAIWCAPYSNWGYQLVRGTAKMVKYSEELSACSEHLYPIIAGDKQFLFSTIQCKGFWCVEGTRVEATLTKCISKFTIMVKNLNPVVVAVTDK